MSLGTYVIAISAALYLVAGAAFIWEGRIAFGMAWLFYAAANVCFIVIGE